MFLICLSTLLILLVKEIAYKLYKEKPYISKLIIRKKTLHRRKLRPHGTPTQKDSSKRSLRWYRTFRNWPFSTRLLERDSKLS